jgi:hypothetical protein
MNCKQGDLAMIVKTIEGKQNGIVVRCLEFYSGPFANNLVSHRPWWRIDRKIHVGSKDGPGGWFDLCPDECLMPINPLDDKSIVEPESIARIE